MGPNGICNTQSLFRMYASDSSDTMWDATADTSDSLQLTVGYSACSPTPPVFRSAIQNKRRRRVKETLGFNEYMKYATRLFKLTDYVPGRDDSLLHDGSMAYLVDHTAFGLTTPIVQVDYFHGCSGMGIHCQLCDDNETDCFAHELICIDEDTQSCFVNAIIQIQERFHIRKCHKARLHGMMVAEAMRGTLHQSLQSNRNEISCRLADFLHTMPGGRSVGTADPAAGGKFPLVYNDHPGVGAAQMQEENLYPAGFTISGSAAYC